MRHPYFTRRTRNGRRVHASQGSDWQTLCGHRVLLWATPERDTVPTRLPSLLAQVTCVRCTEEILYYENWKEVK